MFSSDELGDYIASLEMPQVVINGSPLHQEPKTEQRHERYIGLVDTTATVETETTPSGTAPRYAAAWNHPVSAPQFNRTKWALVSGVFGLSLVVTSFLGNLAVGSAYSDHQLRNNAVHRAEQGLPLFAVGVSAAIAIAGAQAYEKRQKRVQ